MASLRKIKKKRKKKKEAGRQSLVLRPAFVRFKLFHFNKWQFDVFNQMLEHFCQVDK